MKIKDYFFGKISRNSKQFHQNFVFREILKMLFLSHPTRQAGRPAAPHPIPRVACSRATCSQLIAKCVCRGWGVPRPGRPSGHNLGLCGGGEGLGCAPNIRHEQITPAVNSLPSVCAGGWGYPAQARQAGRELPGVRGVLFGYEV